MIASSYPFLDVMWTLLVFFAWVIWFWLLITVFGDVFRRRDLSGWGKAAWLIFVILVPLAYVVLPRSIKRVGTAFVALAVIALG